VTEDAERYLWDRVPVAPNVRGQPLVRETIHEMVASGMIANVKQAWATLEKWSNAGCYDYGVTLDLGWKYAYSKTPARIAEPKESQP
jgi:hypothetical protein